MRNFASLNENVSLAKTFALKERLRLDFRAEAFNIFNRVQFGGPVTNLNSASFGIVSSQANTPRQLQGGFETVLVSNGTPSRRERPNARLRLLYAGILESLGL